MIPRDLTQLYIQLANNGYPFFLSALLQYFNTPWFPALVCAIAHSIRGQSVIAQFVIAQSVIAQSFIAHSVIGQSVKVESVIAHSCFWLLLSPL